MLLGCGDSPSSCRGAQSCRRQWHKARAPAAPRLSHSAADCTALNLEAALGDPCRNVNTNRPGFLLVSSLCLSPRASMAVLAVEGSRPDAVANAWLVRGVLLSVCFVLIRSLSPSPTRAEVGAGPGMVGRLDQGAELEEPVSCVESQEQKTQ